MIPHRAAHKEPVPARHQQIAKDYIGSMLERQFHASLAIFRLDYIPVPEPKHFGGWSTAGMVVVDQQDGLHPSEVAPNLSVLK
jgi:hypothetical protein